MKPEVTELDSRAPEIVFISRSMDETHRAGFSLGRLASRGMVVGLRGSLGAGKTTFVRGFAAGAGVPDPRLVTSPTFVLIQEYDGRIPIFHFDAYRLKESSEFTDLGVTEYFHGEGVCLVEWADKVEATMPDERIEIEFISVGESEREFRIWCIGTRWLEIVSEWNRLLVAQR